MARHPVYIVSLNIDSIMYSQNNTLGGDDWIRLPCNNITTSKRNSREIAFFTCTCIIGTYYSYQ